MRSPKTFEEGMQRLDETLTKLNNPETPLAEALKLYADAAALLAWCDKILAQAKLQMEEIDARKDAGNEGDDTDEQSRSTGNGQDELPQRDKHGNAIAANGIGNHGKDADRGEVHDIARHFEHSFGHALTDIDDGFAFTADMGDGDAKEAGKKDNLQHILAGHGIDDIRRDDVYGIIDEIDAVLAGCSGVGSIGSRRRQGNAYARLCNIHEQQADSQGNGRSELEPNDGLTA